MIYPPPQSATHLSTNAWNDERTLATEEQDEIGWVLILYLTSLKNNKTVET